ncbi:MAG: hypothetical protein ICV73_12445 [Acetobacteraceae bacterium]|nr:hypothetical protein [Acetobacteraceae bacterium]
MRCVECGGREATVVWVQARPPHRDVRRRGDPEPEPEVEDEADAPPAAMEPPPGPNLCAECARRRYEAQRPRGAPSWEDFTSDAS